MKELTIVIDAWYNKELQEYLMSLEGILDVNIKNEKLLEIYIKYDQNLINPKIIKLEIKTFLNTLKIPSIITFDKHSTSKILEYKINRDKICCEYCLKGVVEDLLEIEGIEKVGSNFDINNINKKDIKRNIIINIQYDSTLLNIDDMKEIKLNLDI